MSLQVFFITHPTEFAGQRHSYISLGCPSNLPEKTTSNMRFESKNLGVRGSNPFGRANLPWKSTGWAVRESWRLLVHDEAGPLGESRGFADDDPGAAAGQVLVVVEFVERALGNAGLERERLPELFT